MISFAIISLFMVVSKEELTQLHCFPDCVAGRLWEESLYLALNEKRGGGGDLWTLALKIRANLWNNSCVCISRSPCKFLDCLLLHLHQCRLLLLFSNKWHFVCLLDIFINFFLFVYVCARAHARISPGMIQTFFILFLKSAALFEENLSLICCSCRGPHSQLKRTGFGSCPKEVTTCWPLIGHLGGTKGHRGHLFAISCQSRVV